MLLPSMFDAKDPDVGCRLQEYFGAKSVMPNSILLTEQTWRLRREQCLIAAALTTVHHVGGVPFLKPDFTGAPRCRSLVGHSRILQIPNQLFFSALKTRFLST
jgi:hypothetical protein